MELNLSSSSSSSDEEHIMELLPNLRNLRPRTDLFNYYNDEEFKARFRLSKGCVVRLLSRFENELLKENMKNHPISPMNQLLCTLRFYATGSFQQVIEAEMRYQNAHIRTRNVIERLNGVWKRRFPALRSGMQLKTENILRIIVATAVLHNIANESRQENEIADDNNVFDFPICEAVQLENNIHA
ncbi:dde superfamily endonuclease [Holotrichia oblita]|uniref:Dde superfamily endonuclease n=1 Tax=Holotrichia oblita TaxID=644536 RepID=A0ACB9TH51_HOLOL|nr:dde superfamily endonuclease [Holotrichia oblita]